MNSRRDPSRPQVIAHRGLPREARENTLASFALALEAGCDAIELDVHGTSDGQIVVHHDALLHAIGTTLERPAIAELTLARARARTPPDWPIATLHDVLDLVRGRAQLYVEVKASRIETLVAEVLRRHSTVCAVHSFDHRVAARVRLLTPEIPVGVLMCSYLIDPALPLTLSVARDLWQQAELIDEALVNRVHERGGRVIAWTVNRVSDAVHLTALGVDGICTDVTRDIVATLTGD